MKKAMDRQLQTTPKERVSYGLYFMGQNFFYFFITMFVQVFFTDIGITAAAVGIIFIIARIWDAVNDPIFGVIVDRCRLKSGRFLPWIRISTFLIPIFTVLIFLTPASFPPMLKTILAGTLYICWGMSYTICDVPIFALTTAMTGNLQERVSLISLGRVTGLIGMLLINVIAPILRPKIGWLGISILFALVGFLCMLPIGVNTKERMVDNHSEPITLKNIITYLSKNKYLLIFYGAMIVSSVTNMLQTMGVYFARVNLGDESLFAAIILTMILPMVLAAAVMPQFTKRFDKIYIYMSGLIITVVFSIISYFVGYSNFIIFLIISAVRGLGMGIIMTMMFMFSADCVEYGTYKTGFRAEGITFSIQTFATQMIGAVSSALGMLMLGAFGFVEGAKAVQPQSAVDGIWFMYSIFPAFGAILALILIICFYKLRDKDVQIMTNYNQGKITREEAQSQLSKKY
ncbi:glycoside-pentoside-hexuronide (GPH):cation symporter [Paludicola sp. MB14-C6]|uniref:MFS transporter n=1 Tax=Paludihabitans sp. MB14-C6 TaxID=3070656 RepID=UPI0027DCAFC3|nr:glycoside-pentoside-hexuronide (GPH):cation symporter [Paludicola sp. MB14-C6]WMJ23517.1 glycoside-pentoside-hexuronide (GPH):cation symporter [Paludicola sp. MB14-C6]